MLHTNEPGSAGSPRPHGTVPAPAPSLVLEYCTRPKSSESHSETRVLEYPFRTPLTHRKGTYRYSGRGTCDLLRVVELLAQIVIQVVDLKRNLGVRVGLGVRLRYSSHTARSGLGLARVVRLFVWPRHTNGTQAVAPLDPCACEVHAQGGNKRRTGPGEELVELLVVHEVGRHVAHLAEAQAYHVVILVQNEGLSQLDKDIMW